MGCGCNKSSRSVAARTPTRNVNRAVNMTPEKITETVPLSLTRQQAVEAIKSEVENKFMTPDRLRVEQLRRDAIRKALGK